MHGWTRIYGSFFALEMYGIPFSDPASVFWPLVNGETPTRLWMGLGLTLAIALVFGRIFCGWLCPYGLLSEYAHTAHNKIMDLLARCATKQRVVQGGDVHTPASEYPCVVDSTKMCSCEEVHGCLTNVDNACLAASAQPSLVEAMRQVSGKGVMLGPPDAMDDNSSGFWMRTLILVLGIGTSVFFASPLLQWLSMPGSLSLIPVQWRYGGEAAIASIMVMLALPLLLLIMEALTGLRIWCKWLCPQAVLLSLAAKLGQPFMHVRWDEEACQCSCDQRPCVTACSLRLLSRQKSGPNRSECMQCAACVSVCQCRGHGAMRVGLPRTKKALREE